MPEPRTDSEIADSSVKLVPTLRPQSLSFFCWLSLVWTSAAAGDWQIYRFEGRDYVSLNNIATFYGFPQPPEIPAVPDPAEGTAAPSVPALDASTPSVIEGESSAVAPTNVVSTVTATPVLPHATTSGATASIPIPTPIKTIALDSGKMQLEVTLNSREVMINGAKQWLAFPVHVEAGKALISRLDLSKVVEPRLRPERIEGLQPVTTVILDAGHGGHDKGAISRYGYEKDFALDVAKRARNALESRGFKVVMTRTSDIFIPLEQRPRAARHLRDSIFVSIHFNASSNNAEARGFEIFSIAPRGAPATNDPVISSRVMRQEPGHAAELPSTALAGTIYHSLLGQVPTIDRGLKHARFAVLRLATVPAVLVECGFVTNAPESALIGSPAWRNRVAEAIVEGIQSYKELAVNKQAPKLIADYRRSAPESVGLRDTAPANSPPPQ